MNPHSLIPSRSVVLAALASSFLAAPALLAAGEPPQRPDARETIELRSGERNPFAVQIVEEKATTEPSSSEGLSEEARLRRIFGNLRASGTSVGPDKGQKAMLGSLIVKPGDVLPPLLGNQAEILEVLSIQDSLVTLVFHERDPSAEKRRIVVPVNMRPTVSQFLFGEAVEALAQIDQKGRSALPALQSAAVTEVLGGGQASEVQGLTEREIQLMGVVRDAKDRQQEE